MFQKYQPNKYFFFKLPFSKAALSIFPFQIEEQH